MAGTNGKPGEEMAPHEMFIEMLKSVGITPVVIDIGGDDPEYHERRESAERGDKLDNESESLLSELISIGEADKFLCEDVEEGFDSYRRNLRVREIGERLNEIGGFNLMQSICMRISMQIGHCKAREIEMAWDGIGRWLC